MKKKIYTQELKQQIIKEVEETGNVAVVGRRYEIAPTTIYGWIKKSNREGMTKTSSTNNASTAVEKQLKEVETENERLKRLLGEKDLEIAILKDLLKKTTSPSKIR